MQPVSMVRSFQRPRATQWYLWAGALAIVGPLLIPLLYLAVRTMGEGTAAWNVLTNGRPLKLAANTLGLAGAVTLTAVGLGVAVAWVTNGTDLRHRRLWGGVLALPLVVPSYVTASAYLAAAGPQGVFADWFGISLPFPSGFAGAWLVVTIASYPLVQLATSGAIGRLDRGREEAARLLGAGPGRVFRTVTLPQLRPAITSGALLVALYAISDFGAVSLMRYDTFTRAVYANYQGRVDRTPAVVLAVVGLMGMAMIFILAELRARGRAEAVTGTHRPLTRHQLSPRQRTWALAGLSGLALVALLAPVAVLVSQFERGQGSLSGLSAAARGSLSLAAAAGALGSFGAIPMAVLVSRHRSRASLALERTTYAIHSLPHITVGLAMVHFSANFLPLFYQSFGLLALSCAAIFLPLAIAPTRAALDLIDPHLEEASRTLGKRQLATLARVTIPMMRGGLASGGLLVFLATLKELPVTLLLRPTGFETLPTRIWSASNDLFYAKAAAPALLLVGLAAVPSLLLTVRSLDA